MNDQILLEEIGAINDAKCVGDIGDVDDLIYSDVQCEPSGK